MANQYEVDPRQAEFLKHYLDPKSGTFSNALQSALKAGYSEEYARNILSLMPDWLSESIDDATMLSKVRKNLNEFLETEDDKIRLDATKFVGETIGKAKYSKRSELTGKDGKDFIPIEGFNYVVPNTNNTTDTETTSSVEETEGQDN